MTKESRLPAASFFHYRRTHEIKFLLKDLRTITESEAFIMTYLRKPL